MTEQSKIPMPESAPEAGPHKHRSATLIERVVRNYDLVKLAPAPIPEDLVPPPSARRRFHHADEVIEEAEVAPVAAPEVAERPVPELVGGGEAMAFAPGVASAALKVPAEQREPVVFKGQHYPLDRHHLRDQGLIVPESTVTAVLEEFRIVKRQLLRNADQLAQQGMGPAAQRVLICSPHPGEGKSFTAVNLALAIAAEKECEVLLVDADFAKPSVLSMLGLPGGLGLMDALANPEIDAADCVIGTDVPGLWVLPAGCATTSDTEYLSSSRTRAVLDRLVQGVPQRFVIFDSPPVLAASPAAALAKYVGQAVVVARCDKTGQGSLEDAISLLSACPNIQLILNAVHFSPSGRRFGSYYGYGG
jgi:Mrp family chromosome partitioning ATPase